MEDDRLFFDVYNEFKGYKFVVTKLDGTKAVFTLTEEEFKERKQLINWLDFLIKTNQWIPFALWKDLFDIKDLDYVGLKEVLDLEVHYIEIINKFKRINLL